MWHIKEQMYAIFVPQCNFFVYCDVPADIVLHPYNTYSTVYNVKLKYRTLCIENSGNVLILLYIAFKDLLYTNQKKT